MFQSLKRDNERSDRFVRVLESGQGRFQSLKRDNERSDTGRGAQRQLGCDGFNPSSGITSVLTCLL